MASKGPNVQDYEDLIDDNKVIRLPVRKASQPYRIKFGDRYHNWDDKRKIDWLEKFASSMNEAADRLQKEGIQLNKLLFAKEGIIKKLYTERDGVRQLLNKRLQAENQVQQAQAERINELMAEVKRLKEKLGSGNNN